MTIKWHDDNGIIISCIEKNKVMDQNLQELKLLLQDIVDDGVLMGISETQIQEIIAEIVRNISSNY